MTRAAPSSSSSSSSSAAGPDSDSDLPSWGRVLIVGGTDWPCLGRKATKSGPQLVANPSQPDLLSPHILRSVSNIRMKRVISSHSSCHAVLLSLDGDAYVLGRNEQAQCGLNLRPDPPDPPHPPHPPQPVLKPSGLKPSGPAIWDAYKLDRMTDFHPALPPKATIVHAATGRSHTLLITDTGSVYAAGLNSNGQCGLPAKQSIIIGFHRIDVAPFVKDKDPVISASCGLTFSMLLTAAGRVYAMGSSEKGQLGNGRTGEHFISNNKLAFITFDEPFLVKSLADKKITSIQCGQQHTIALDADGYVYVWGFGGYGRLGIGTQQDQLQPTLVPQFARENSLTRAKAVYAGPTNSAVLDGQRMFWLAGKWKNSGEGSAGQGFMTFKYLPDMMGVKVSNAGLGGVTLLCTATEEDSSMRGDHGATMNICWGQNAHHGELGLGEGKPRSATKPLRCENLDGIGIIDIGAGQHTTFYIARNTGPTYSELPRFPSIVQSSDSCQSCHSDQSTDTNALLECEKCENPWHLRCLNPPLNQIPEGEWHCPTCLPPPSQSSSKRSLPPSSPSPSKRRKA